MLFRIELGQLSDFPVARSHYRLHKGSYFLQGLQGIVCSGKLGQVAIRQHERIVFGHDDVVPL